MRTYLKTAAAAALLIGLGACASTNTGTTETAETTAPAPVVDTGPSDVVTTSQVPSASTPINTDSGVVGSSIRAGSLEDFRVNVGERVYFDLDQYRLDSDDQAVLQRQAAWLQSYPGVNILVAGNCDERGTREYNLALGERRASVVKDYLESLGVDPARIETVSYGKERPIAGGNDSQSWAQNRNGFTQLVSGVSG